MPKVVVHLHTVYQKKTEQGMVRRIEFEISSRLPVFRLLQELQVEIATDNTLIVVNGKSESIYYEIKPNDEIHVIPAISGG